MGDEGLRALCGVIMQLVLVVEDEEIIRDMTVEFLHDAGLDVIEATTADSAVQLLEERNKEISVLFTDVRMPGHMDGLELSRTAMERWPHIKVVVTSGMFNKTTDTVPPGATFLPKPWLPLEMLTMITQAVEQRSR